MGTIAEWQANLDALEEILASNPTDQDALSRKETTIAYIAFLEENERRRKQGIEEAADNTNAEPSMVPIKINFVQMMQLFTITLTINAASVPPREAKDTSDSEAEVKRRCIQSLCVEQMTLLQQLATEDAKGEFACFLRSNGFTSTLDYGMTRYKDLKNHTINMLIAEENAATEQAGSTTKDAGDGKNARATTTTEPRPVVDASEHEAVSGANARGLPQVACNAENARGLPQCAMGGPVAGGTNNPKTSQGDSDSGDGDDGDGDDGAAQNKPSNSRKTRKKDRRKKKTDTGEAVDLESHIDNTTEVNNAFVTRVRGERAETESLGEEGIFFVLGKCNIFLPILMHVVSVISVVKGLHDIEVAATVLGRVVKPMMSVIARAQASVLDAESNKSKRKVANIKRKYAFGDVDQPVSVLLHAYDDPDTEEEGPSRTKDPIEEAAKACQTIMSTFTNLITIIRVYRQVTLDELVNGCSPTIKRRMVDAKKKFEEAISKDGDKLHIGDMTVADIYDEYLLPHTRPDADASIRLNAITLMGEITTRLGYQEWSHLFTAAEAVPLTQLFESLNRGQIKAMSTKISDPFYSDQVRRTRAARIGESLLYVHKAAAALGQNKPEEEKRDIENDLPLALLCLAPSNFKGSGIGFLSDSRLQADAVDVDYVEELLDVESDSTESEALNELYKSLRSAMLAGEKEHLFTDISGDLRTKNDSTASLLSRYFDYLPAAIKEIEAASGEVEE